MLYILDKSDLSIKDIIQVSNYQIEENISLKGTMSFTLHRIPIAEKDDFIKYGEYIGIIDSLNSNKQSDVYTVQVDDIHSLFDRDIILTNEALLASTGIEDFISQVIYDRFTDSTDTLLNIDYLSTSVTTHTPLNITVDTQQGVYNFMSFLALAKLTYDIDLDFSISNGVLNCVISKNTESEFDMDLTITDIVDYDVVFSVDVIAKVTVYSEESTTETDYFLLSAGTITTTSSDPDRVIGKTSTVVVSTDAEVEQKAIDTFLAYSYKHNISFSLISDSLVYEKEQLYINKPLRVKTSENGVFSTFISKITTSMKSNVIQVECGNTKVSLIDILKGAL